MAAKAEACPEFVGGDPQADRAGAKGEEVRKNGCRTKGPRN